LAVNGVQWATIPVCSEKVCSLSHIWERGKNPLVSAMPREAQR
jgi:hypothetical protein